MNEFYLVWSSNFVPYALASAVIVGALLGALLALVSLIFDR